VTAGEPDVLVTGATGFVGTAVLRELVGRGMGPRVRVLVRRPVPEWMTEAGVTTWAGDLTDAPGLAGLCTGITTLVHLASQVGGDPALCAAVNEEGTGKLLAEARRAGTADVLYLSTCAVYRDGVHRGEEVPAHAPDLAARVLHAVGAVAEPGPARPAEGSGAAGEPGSGLMAAPAWPAGGIGPAGEPRSGLMAAPAWPSGGSGPSGRRAPKVRSVLVADPASATSRSRLAGERLVLAAGGTVLRPHLVHGEGDRHVVPALVRWIRAVPAWAAFGAARTSLVAVADLAAAIAVLALNPRLRRPSDVLHVADPRPVRMRSLVTAVCELLDLAVPAASLSLAEHRARTRAALPSLTDHQYSLLTRDHWYESDRIWAMTGVSPGPGFGTRLTEAASWYRESLGTRLAGEKTPA
jgi:nucleoside-diphosphate-sugar epimerase